jgi:hypothetical protein
MSQRKKKKHNEPNQLTVQQEASSQWTMTPHPRKSKSAQDTGGPRGKINEVLYISDSSTPLSILLLFFAKVITLLVVQTNQYYYHYLDTLDSGPSPVLDMTEREMYVFLALTMQMRHYIQD